MTKLQDCENNNIKTICYENGWNADQLMRSLRDKNLDEICLNPLVDAAPDEDEEIILLAWDDSTDNHFWISKKALSELY